MVRTGELLDQDILTPLETLGEGPGEASLGPFGRLTVFVMLQPGEDTSHLDPSSVGLLLLPYDKQ